MTRYPIQLHPLQYSRKRHSAFLKDVNTTGKGTKCDRYRRQPRFSKSASANRNVVVGDDDDNVGTFIDRYVFNMSSSPDVKLEEKEEEEEEEMEEEERL